MIYYGFSILVCNDCYVSKSRIWSCRFMFNFKAKTCSSSFLITKARKHIFPVTRARSHDLLIRLGTMRCSAELIVNMFLAVGVWLEYTFWKVIWQYVSRDFKMFRFIALRAPLQEIYSKEIIQRLINALNIAYNTKELETIWMSNNMRMVNWLCDTNIKSNFRNSLKIYLGSLLCYNDNCVCTYTIN